MFPWEREAASAPSPPRSGRRRVPQSTGDDANPVASSTTASAIPTSPKLPLRALGSSGLHVTTVCLGTMTFGVQNTEAEAHAQLDYAIKERGVNFIDTAEMCG